LRGDPLLRGTVVFIMTTSAAEEDRLCAYAKNVAGYILKHRSQLGFLETISMLQHYWQVIEFPVCQFPVCEFPA
jgi:DNA-binding NarL/FixJ family response regulator